MKSIVEISIGSGWRQMLLALLLCAAPMAGRGQFDDKFYRPAKEWLAESGLPPHEDVWIVSGADSIHAVWCAPTPAVPALASVSSPVPASELASTSVRVSPAANVEPRAVVLLCHGNYGNISYNGAIVRPLVEAGYAVLVWDYPGFGRSTGTPTHAAIAEAGARVFGTLTAHPATRDKKVVIYGFSIGCHIAARLARENPERTAALVLDGGMTSFTEMAVVFSPPEAHDAIRQYVVSPYSAIEDVAHLEGVPKLVAHSREDKIAPFAHSEAIFEAAAGPKTFLEYAGGHVSALAANAPEALAAISKLIL